jgi:hypothetical protein
MKINLSLMLGVLLCAGCSSSRFAPEGEFAKDLKGFTRVEPKDLEVESGGSAEEKQRAQAFARNFGKDLLGRLHSGKILDATEGPAVIIKGRLTKYNWIYTPGSVSLPPNTSGTIEIVFSFWNEKGTCIGRGMTSTRDGGTEVGKVMDVVENTMLDSVYEFLQSKVGDGQGKP